MIREFPIGTTRRYELSLPRGKVLPGVLPDSTGNIIISVMGGDWNYDQRVVLILRNGEEFTLDERREGFRPSDFLGSCIHSMTGERVYVFLLDLEAQL